MQLAPKLGHAPGSLFRFTLAGAGVAPRWERMAELFELTTKYEVAFWEMAVTGDAWPGLD